LDQVVRPQRAADSVTWLDETKYGVSIRDQKSTLGFVPLMAAQAFVLQQGRNVPTEIDDSIHLGFLDGSVLRLAVAIQCEHQADHDGNPSLHYMCHSEVACWQACQ
jgi:hypothetical protein